MKRTPLFRCHVGSIKFPFSRAADKMTEEQATRVHNIISLCKFGEYIIVKFFELNKNDNLKLIKKYGKNTEYSDRRCFRRATKKCNRVRI